VKVQTNTYDAEMGRTGGGVFNTTLKSGSNELHVRLSAIRGRPIGSRMGSSRTPVDAPVGTPFYNYGGSIGGPVIVPKLYNGRNRRFSG